MKSNNKQHTEENSSNKNETTESKDECNQDVALLTCASSSSDTMNYEVCFDAFGDLVLRNYNVGLGLFMDAQIGFRCDEDILKLSEQFEDLQSQDIE